MINEVLVYWAPIRAIGLDLSWGKSFDKKGVLIKVYAWSIVGNLQNPRRATNKNGSLDEDGHEARQHDKDLEHIGPYDRLHASLGWEGHEDRLRRPGSDCVWNCEIVFPVF